MTIGTHMEQARNEQKQRLRVYQHLHEALEADEVREKNYHVRQTLQLLGIENIQA